MYLKECLRHKFYYLAFCFEKKNNVSSKNLFDCAIHFIFSLCWTGFRNWFRIYKTLSNSQETYVIIIFSFERKRKNLYRIYFAFILLQLLLCTHTHTYIKYRLFKSVHLYVMWHKMFKFNSYDNGNFFYLW